MKKLLSIVAAILFAATTFAKEGNLKDVTLVTNGSGRTKQEAVNYALRSALEQTFGTFVSTNTSIVNDNLTKDEIVSISTGNIKNYKELSSAVLPSGQFAVVVQSTISLSKLTTYAKSHGSSCELAGATFAQNMKLRKLNAQNEGKVLNNLGIQLKEIEKSLFDISIATGTPKISKTYGETYDIPITLTLKGCENSEAAMNLLFTTLDNLNMSAEERADYDRTNDNYYLYEIAGREYWLRTRTMPRFPLDLNRMLRELKIVVHGKATFYYKLDVDNNGSIRSLPSDNVPTAIKLGRSGGRSVPVIGNWTSARTHYGAGERRSSTASMIDSSREKIINQLPYIYDKKERHECIYNLGAYYAADDGKKSHKKSKKSYSTITFLHFDIIVPQSAMESISKIEIIP